MTAPLSERATIKIGKYEWFQRATAHGASQPGTKYVCRVCGPSRGLLSRGGRIPHVLRDLRRLGLEGCWDRITRRFLNVRIDRHRRRGQFYHESPQGIAYLRPEYEG
jgi:hypothetical protein